MGSHGKDCECCKDGYGSFREKTDRLIKEYGVAVIGTAIETARDNLSMSYTIGLSDVGKPEIVVFGLPHETAMALLNDAALLQRDDLLKLNEPTQEIGNLPLIFKSVSTAVAANYIIQANVRAGRDLSVIQMVWPDPEGLFPWEPKFAKRFAPMQLALYQSAH